MPNWQSLSPFCSVAFRVGVQDGGHGFLRPGYDVRLFSAAWRWMAAAGTVCSRHLLLCLVARCSRWMGNLGTLQLLEGKRKEKCREGKGKTKWQQKGKRPEEYDFRLPSDLYSGRGTGRYEAVHLHPNGHSVDPHVHNRHNHPFDLWKGERVTLQWHHIL